jgi:hypothetical protein
MRRSGGENRRSYHSKRFNAKSTHWRAI